VAKVGRLTHRQRQVLILLAQGLTHEQAAARIGITARTVKLHRAALMARLQCRHLADLVRVHDACQALLDGPSTQALA
jgi:FixJ family two-component response regulator